ncbi:hypothetical protein H4R33_006819 [Dimargaris cristalligena]|nr:hypothetical protein H4R33_006819 [Dimargaris cristalligena]
MVYVPDPARDLIAGTVGGWAQVVVGHPFDTIKPSALFKGVTSPLAGIGICNAVVFTANGYFRKLLQGDHPRSPIRIDQAMLAGSMAGSVMAFFNCPIELLKVKLQVQGPAATATAGAPAIAAVPQYTGVFNCGVRTFREQGLRGLYRGFSITFIRDVPSFGCYFGAYELTKQLLARRRSPETFATPGAGPHYTNTGLELCLAGGVAGIAAWLFCYPQDIVKSRMQSNPSYPNTLACFRILWKEAQGPGNWRVFFRGFGPTLARAFPANAATFVAYEWALKHMS